MYRRKNQPRLPAQASATPPLCQQFGHCVCQGLGQMGCRFASNLSDFLKPMFTPPRKKKKNEHIRVEPPEVKAMNERKVQNRKHLVDGMIVVRLQRYSETDRILQKMSAHEDGSLAIFQQSLGLFSLGPKWAKTMASTLAGESLEPAGSRARDTADSESDFDFDGGAVDAKKHETAFDDLWFHIGYVNYSSWRMVLLRLSPVGEPDEHGLQRLEVQHISCKLSAIFFAKLLNEEAFASHWEAKIYKIKTHLPRLSGEDVKPNWILVEAFNPVAGHAPAVSFCFWTGWSNEQQKLKEETKKATKSKAKSQGQATATAKTAKRSPQDLGSWAALKRQRRQNAAGDMVTEQESPETFPAPEDCLENSENQGADADIEDPLSSGSDGANSLVYSPSLAATDDLEAQHYFEENTADFSDADLDFNLGNNDEDISASLLLPEPVSTHPFADKVEATASPSDMPSANHASEVSQQDGDQGHVEIEFASATATASQKVEDAPQDSVGQLAPDSVEPHAPDSAVEPADSSGALPRKARTQADDRIAWDSTSDVRYNPLSGRLLAVCHFPNHLDCRRSRTTAAAARLTTPKMTGQGRPIGLLCAWLSRASEFLMPKHMANYWTIGLLS